jgi:hypothetical protein
MYHPAAALRTPSVERESFEDVARVPALLLRSRERREAARQEPVPPASAAAPTASAPEAPTPDEAREPVGVMAPNLPDLAVVAEPTADDSSQLTLF